MENTLQTAHNWINHLNKTLLNSEARRQGQDITLEKGLEELGHLLKEASERHSSVWWVGNGGSSAICSHLAQDVLNKLQTKSFFCGDTALLTCMANDFGYEDVYQRPLSMFMEKGDLLIAISSSGNSANIINCARLAKEKQAHLVTLSGFQKENVLWNIPADMSFYVNSNLYGIVELAHEAILHAVIETLYLNFFAKGKKI